ncbi:NAD(P)H:quinone oxidoreductase, type IV, partial [Absidia repens]
MDDDQKPKLYIVLYSLYHHVYKLATEIAKGAEAGGCDVKIFQVEETLSNDILDKLRAPDRPDLPIITAAQLAEADGFLFGLPTRFGMFPTQVKTLLDATGSLWAKNGLAHKFAGFFISTASSHGGSSSFPCKNRTALTAVSYLVHHGINYISFGYPNPALFDNSKVIGGTPYGSTTIANGDGSRQPIKEELDLALNQGENFGNILTTYHRG